MSDYTAKRISEMDAIFGGGFKKARAELGVTSFGFQVIEMPPGFDGYPHHDHAEEGQEEVYVVLAGEAELIVGEDRLTLDRETMVRVAPDAKRKVVTRDRGVRLLVCGGVPGRAFTPKPATEVGAPAPPLGTPVG